MALGPVTMNEKSQGEGAGAGEDAGATVTYRPSTPQELVEQERTEASVLKGMFDNYINFPTIHNRDSMVERMNYYQHCWMQGRKRFVQL